MKLHAPSGRMRIPSMRGASGIALSSAVCAGLLLCLAGVSGAAAEADAEAPPPLVVFATTAGTDAETSPSAASTASPLADNATLKAIRSDPVASDIHIGRSDSAAITAALDARALSVLLPASPEAPATLLSFTAVEVEHNDGGLVSLYAQNIATDAEVALVVQGADLLGSIRRGQETWKVQPLGNGATAVYRYDISQLRHHPPNWGDFMWKNMRMQIQAPSRDDTEAAGSAQDTGDVIDLLVAYTPKAREAAGNMDTFIQFAIDNAHRSYRNSNIDFRLRLVHTHEVNYSQDADMTVDLERLTGLRGIPWYGGVIDPEGHMDEVHALRDRYGADLVALIVEKETNNWCGFGWMPDFGRYPNADHSDTGFSVMGQNCELVNFYTFAHELGHNQGAHHDPDNTCDSPPCTLPSPPTFQYRHGRCNVAESWNTIMAYGANRQGSCSREIPYFSSPNLRYQGTPTGDAAVRDNRRVLLETTRRVANYRQSVNAPAALAQTLPLVTAASNRGQQSFVRIINHAERAGTASIQAIDDTGRRAGPITLSLDAKAAKHFNSRDLEEGNPSKGLSGGVGQGNGNWRLEVSADTDIEALAYIRTPDGFVTSMHEVAAETAEGSNRYRVPFLNPGSNTNQQSFLRLVNPGTASAALTILSVDDRGDAASQGEVRLTLGPGTGRMLSARDLERGASGLSGRLGDGAGKWRLDVQADHPILVMSLLQLPTGHLTNLSRGRDGVSVAAPPPNSGPDLVVDSVSGDDSVSAGQSFRLSALVRNQGVDPSAATTLRYYRSPDATIAASDTRVGTDSVAALAAAGTSRESISLNAPSTAGTYFYGACVDTVSGESDVGNNCSPAWRVTVSRPPGSQWGAIAAGWEGQYCQDGFGWGFATNYSDRNSAIARAESECRSRGLNRCQWAVTFEDCGSLAYGQSTSRCNLFGGYGSTRSAAERDALSDCRAEYPDCRLGVDSESGRNATFCNAGAGAVPRAEAQSSGGITAFPFGASNPEARPEPVPSRRGEGRR